MAPTRSSSARSATSRPCGVAAVIRLDDDGTIAGAGVGVTGVADSPFAATDAETVLTGRKPSEELFRDAGAAAGQRPARPRDIRGPVEYKRAMAAELTLRSLRSGRRSRPRVRVAGEEPR